MATPKFADVDARNDYDLVAPLAQAGDEGGHLDAVAAEAPLEMRGSRNVEGDSQVSAPYRLRSASRHQSHPASARWQQPTGPARRTKSRSPRFDASSAILLPEYQRTRQLGHACGVLIPCV